MALRDQPYFPLYVQDYLTDEKLNMCGLASQGLYIKILCLLHKQEKYGAILLQQKRKQIEDKKVFFVDYISKQIPVQREIIAECLTELIDEGVLTMDDEMLYQKRMVRDGEISKIRQKAGNRSGGSRLNRQYGKGGFLYLASDMEAKHKIGVSTNVQQRIYQLRSKNRLSKFFDLRIQIEVNDMGKAEDVAKKMFADNMAGEWINMDYEDIVSRFDLLEQKLQQKTQQNTEYENEYENESEYENKDENKNEKEKNSLSLSLLKNKEKEKEKEADKEKKEIKVKAIPRKKYGEYKHVFLTEEEYERFVNDFGLPDAREAIKLLDEYIELKGAKYKNHNLALRKWPIKQIREDRGETFLEKSIRIKRQLGVIS